ncbi:LOW QUALITY PROTEIN: oxidoreductase, FAD-binding, partial [Streptomyces himastatinicus ATCC 53653]
CRRRQPPPHSRPRPGPPRHPGRRLAGRGRHLRRRPPPRRHPHRRTRRGHPQTTMARRRTRTGPAPAPAPHQGGLRSARHPQPGQGAL